MKCPNCGQDNLDFKIVCGYCGTQLRNFPEKTEISKPIDDQASSQEADMQSRALNRKLVYSEAVGILLLILPILLSALAYIFTSYLIGINEISSPYILVVSSLILMSLGILAGSIIFNEGWSLESIESPIKGVIAFFLCASLLFVCIFGSIAIFDSTSQYQYHEPINLQTFPNSGVVENWKIDTASEAGIVGWEYGIVIRNILAHSSIDPVLSYPGIDLRVSSNCLIENCIFIGPSIGIDLNSCHDIVIRNCTFSVTNGVILSNCQNIEIVNCVFSSEYYILKDNNCSGIVDESNTVKAASQLPKYSDFLFPPLASVAEALLIILFVVWLFLFGWLRAIRPGDL